MTKPTAEDALEWLGQERLTLDCSKSNTVWCDERPLATGSTPLEAIRNAMKGEGDGS